MIRHTTHGRPWNDFDALLLRMGAKQFLADAGHAGDGYSIGTPEEAPLCGEHVDGRPIHQLTAIEWRAA